MIQIAQGSTLPFQITFDTAVAVDIDVIYMLYNANNDTIIAQGSVNDNKLTKIDDKTFIGQLSCAETKQLNNARMELALKNTDGTICVPNNSPIQLQALTNKINTVL